MLSTAENVRYKNHYICSNVLFFSKYINSILHHRYHVAKILGILQRNTQQEDCATVVGWLVAFLYYLHFVYILFFIYFIRQSLYFALPILSQYTPIYLYLSFCLGVHVYFSLALRSFTLLISLSYAKFFSFFAAFKSSRMLNKWTCWHIKHIALLLFHSLCVFPLSSSSSSSSTLSSLSPSSWSSFYNLLWYFFYTIRGIYKIHAPQTHTAYITLQ